MCSTCMVSTSIPSTFTQANTSTISATMLSRHMAILSLLRTLHPTTSKSHAMMTRPSDISSPRMVRGVTWPWTIGVDFTNITLLTTTLPYSRTLSEQGFWSQNRIAIAKHFSTTMMKMVACWQCGSQLDRSHPWWPTSTQQVQ